jgi:hypothetical protein
MPKPPIYFNRLAPGSGTSVDLKGSAPTISGTLQYGDSIFGRQALYCDEVSNANNLIYTSFPRGPEQTYEFWMKTNGWTFDGVTTSDGKFRAVIDFGGASGYEGNGELRIMFLTGAGFYVNSQNLWQVGFTQLTLSDNVWTHIAVTLSSAISKISLYKNGVLLGYDWDSEFNNYTTGNFPQQAIGKTPYLGDTFGLIGWIANFKIYEYAKTEFSDRFNERGGMNDNLVLG